jgi:outer membrane protein TolC
MKLLFLILLFPINSLSSELFLKTVKDFLDVDPLYQDKLLQRDYRKTVLNEARSQLLLPSIGFTTSINKNESISSNDTIDYKSSNLNLSYSLFNFGSDYSNLRSKQLSLNSFKSDLLSTSLEREASIIKALLSYVSWQKKIKIQKEIYDLKSRLLKLSQKKYKRGSLSSINLLKVEIDKVNAESEYLLIRQGALSIESTVRSYIGDKALSLSEYPLTKYILNIGGKESLIKSFEINNNPKLKFLKYASDSSHYELKREKRLQYGSFSLEHSRSLYQNDNSDDKYGHSTSVVYTLPLFEKFSREKLIQNISAKAMSANYHYKLEKRFLESSIKTSKERLSISLRNFRNRAKILESSQKLFDSSSSQFKKGKLSVNELLIEQNRLLQTKLLSNTAVHDLHIQYMELVHLYGLRLSDRAY